jgi:hypothetical protein
MNEKGWSFFEFLIDERHGFFSHLHNLFEIVIVEVAN